jgi:hypothetical protein
MEIDIEKVIPAIAKIGYHGLELAVTSRWPTALETLTNSKRHRISELLDQYNRARIQRSNGTLGTVKREDYNQTRPTQTPTNMFRDVTT